MKRKMLWKKGFSFAVALTMLITLLPVGVLAEQGRDENISAAEVEIVSPETEGETADESAAETDTESREEILEKAEEVLPNNEGEEKSDASNSDTDDAPDADEKDKSETEAEAEIKAEAVENAALSAGAIGLEKDPDDETRITITNAAGLDELSYMVRDAREITYVELANNIDLSELDEAWLPIGTDSQAAFKGVFEGNGHSISNLEVTSSGLAGLFGYTSGAEIRNLTVVDPKVKNTGTNTSAYAGAVAAFAADTAFSNIRVKYSDTEEYVPTAADKEYGVSGSFQAGGVVGHAQGGSFYNVINYVNVYSESKRLEKGAAGGIAGFTDRVDRNAAVPVFRYIANYGRIYCQSAATGQNSETNAMAIGGLIGYLSDGYVYHSYNAGDLYYNDESNQSKMGGLFGYYAVGYSNVTAAEFCFTYGMVTGKTYTNNHSLSGESNKPYPYQGVIAGQVGSETCTSMSYVYGESGKSTYDKLSEYIGEPNIIYATDALEASPLVSLVPKTYMQSGLFNLLTINGAGYWTAGASGYPVFDLEGVAEEEYTEANPFRIYTAADLIYFSAYVNSGHPESCAVLMNDIDMAGVTVRHMPESLSGITWHNSTDKYFDTKDMSGNISHLGTSWIPIGTSAQQYAGTFDGNGHTISNLNYRTPYMKDSSNTGVSGEMPGLFGYVAVNGTVKNVTLDKMTRRVASRNSSSDVTKSGTIVSNNAGTIENCINLGGGVFVAEVNSVNNIGGIAGSNSGNIVDCVNYESIAREKASQYIAGITPINSGTISGCSNYGDMDGACYIAGIVGSVSGGTVTKCYNAGKISSNASKDRNTVYGVTAGIAGTVSHSENAHITDCWNSGSVTSTNGGIGGIVGEVPSGETWSDTETKRARILNCLNTGNIGANIAADRVPGISGLNEVGGIVGHQENYSGVETTNCLNTGIVNGDYDFTAGVIVCINAATNTQTKAFPRTAIHYCYTTTNDLYQSLNSRWFTNGLDVYVTQHSYTIAEKRNAIKTYEQMKKGTEDGLDFVALLNADHHPEDMGDEYEPNREFMTVNYADWAFVNAEDYEGTTDYNILNGYPVLLGVGPTASQKHATFTVTYTDGVDNEVIFEDQKTEGLTEEDDTPKFRGPEPTRSGYIFAGWGVDEIPEKVTETVTYTAQWKEDRNNNSIADEDEEKYTVTYTDGVDNVEIFANQVTNNLLSGEDMPKFNGETKRSGYIFAGWGVDEIPEKVTETVTYTAQWKEDRNNNGIADSEEDQLIVKYTDGVEDEEIFPDQVTDNLVAGNATPAFQGGNPTRVGYIFDGWDVKNIPSRVTESVTYTAQWKADKNNNNVPDEEEEHYAVTYKDGVEDAEVFADKTIDNLVIGQDSPAFDGELKREGYVFAGWTPEVAEKVEGNATYTAQWKADRNNNGIADEDETKYTITYTDGVDNAEIFTDQKTENLLSGDATPAFDGTPGRSGYTFTGWTPEVAEKVTGDVTYTAQWRANGSGGGGGTGGGGGGSSHSGGGSSAVSGGGNNVVDIPDENVPLADVPNLNTVDHFAYMIGYDDGTVRPENNISRAEVATIFFRLLTEEYRNANWASENSYADVNEGDWFNTAISTASKAGILTGYEDGTFCPEQMITRAEFAAIAVRFLSGSAEAASTFSDIDGHWAKDNILKAVAVGWINGYEDGTFRPDQMITRAEAASLINRMLNRDPQGGMLDDMVTFTDNPADAWYYSAIQEAANSHSYELVANAEKWTQILENRDWSELERR